MDMHSLKHTELILPARWIINPELDIICEPYAVIPVVRSSFMNSSLSKVKVSRRPGLFPDSDL